MVEIEKARFDFHQNELSRFPMVGLTDLDSNKCKAILRHKVRILRGDNPEVTSAAIISDGVGLHNREVDEFGEIAVKRLERSYRKDFSDDEIEQIISSYGSDTSTIDLADRFGCCKNTINKLLREHGIEVTREKAKVRVDTEVAITMYQMGETMEKIAEHFGVSSHTINSCLHRNGVKIRSRWDYPADK